MSPETKTTDVNLDALNAEAWGLRLTDPRRAYHVGRRAARLARRLGQARAVAESNRTLGSCLIALSHTRAARRHFLKALDASRALGDGAMEAYCLNGLGLTCYHENAFTTAMEWYTQALTRRREMRDNAGQASVLNNIGLIYYYLGDYQACLDYYTQALENLGPGQDAETRSMTLGNVGRVYWDIGDWEQALYYHQEGLSVSRLVSKGIYEAYALSSLGVTLARAGRSTEARPWLEAALALARTLGATHEHLESLHYLGVIDAAEGEWGRAVMHLESALVLTKTSPEMAPPLLVCLGRARRALSQNSQAFDCLSQAAALAADMDQKSVAGQAHEVLSDMFEQAGNSGEALRHHKLFHAAECADFQEATERRTQALLLRMEVGNIQKKAEIHRLENVELAHRNEALLQADREKSELLDRLRAQAEELQAQSEELERLATEDALTGLYNRRFMESWLARRFTEAQQHSLLAAALIDIDCFKQINDNFSHEVGDEVLRALADLMRRGCRTGDVVARHGGEEFVLGLPGTSPGQALEICERLRLAVLTHPWSEIRAGLRVTISVGICGDTSLANHERLLSRADQCLYAAKHAGRNRCVLDDASTA